MKIILTAINAKFIHSNPAVYALRAYASAYRDQIEILEYTINQRAEDLLADLYAHASEGCCTETGADVVICFSCYIWNIELVHVLLRELPKLLPDAPIFLGGPEVSFNAPEILREFPAVRGIMIGEGEETFEELCKVYFNSYSDSDDQEAALQNIRGLYLPMPDRAPSGSTAETVFTGERPPMDMDALPFFYDEWKDDPSLGPFRNKILYYESSRGCPFRCSYCLSSLDKTLRTRSLDLVFRELEFFLERNVPQVKFIDRTFNALPSHSEAVWQYLLEHDNGVTNFHFEIGADLLTENALSILSKMRPGLVQLETGVQSVNPATISEIQRSMSLPKLRENTERIHGFKNIHQHLDLIAGLPYEDLESFRNSFNRVFEMEPDQLQLGFLKVLKGSRMEECSTKYGLVYTTVPPYEVLRTDWLSYSDLRLLKQVEEMTELYYNSCQFTKTLPVLISESEDAFSFFLDLSRYEEGMGFAKNSPARIARYDALLRFAADRHPEREALYRELLTCDLYLREHMKSRPAFSSDPAPYKEALRALDKKINRKQCHIEVFFHADVIFGLPVQDPDKPRYILFDYTKIDPLSRNAQIEDVTSLLTDL